MKQTLLKTDKHPPPSTKIIKIQRKENDLISLLKNNQYSQVCYDN